MRVLIVFDDVIAAMESNEKLSPIVTELFLRRKKLNIWLVFISQSYFKVPNTIRLNATHYFVTKIPSKKELQELASIHSSDIDSKEPYPFLVNDTTFSADSPLRFSKSLL